MKRINLDALAEHLIPHLETLLTTHAPAAKREANGWRLGNVYGEKGKSLWIGERGYRDHATGEDGSHITFFSHLWGCKLVEAAKRLAKETNFPIDDYSDDHSLRPIQPTVKFEALQPRHEEYISKRSLDPAFFKQLPIYTASNGALAFLHFTESGKLAFVKFCNVEDKKWWSDKTDIHHVPWLVDYVAQVYPDAQRLYITEGHWDAIACNQLGFPTVSIPNGATNHQWIQNVDNFLASFKEVVLCYDADTAGAEALAIATTMIERPIRVIDLPEGCKDPNDVLQQYGADKLKAVLNEPTDYDPPEIVHSFDLYERAKEELVSDFELDTPWQDGLKFAFRAHESTVLTAYTGHGKSNFYRQILTWLAHKHRFRSFSASFEDTPLKNTHQIIESLHGHPDARQVLSHIDWFDPAHPKYRNRRVTLEELLNLFSLLYRKRGIRFFGIDNLMCLDINRDDYKEQADAAELVRQWVREHSAHLLLVAHPRKKPSNFGNSLNPPDISEIKGAGEIGDAAFNIISFLRCVDKERKLDEMRFGMRADDLSIHKYDTSHPDAIIQVQKQRWDGALPTRWLWRDAFGNFHQDPARNTVWWR